MRTMRLASITIASAITTRGLVTTSVKTRWLMRNTPTLYEYKSLILHIVRVLIFKKWGLNPIFFNLKVDICLMVLKKVCTHCDTAQIKIFYKRLICSNIQEIAQTPTESLNVIRGMFVRIFLFYFDYQCDMAL